MVLIFLGKWRNRFRRILSCHEENEHQKRYRGRNDSNLLQSF